MRSLRSRVCLRLASALAALASVPAVWVFWLRKGSPCSYNHAAIHTYPFPLPFNPSPIKPPSRFPLGAFSPCGRLGQSGFCPLRAQSLVLSPTGLRNDICSRLISWLRLALPRPFVMATARLRAQWLRGSVVRAFLPLPRPCALRNGPRFSIIVVIIGSR